MTTTLPTDGQLIAILREAARSRSAALPGETPEWQAADMIAALSQQVAELTEALRPFAAMAAHYDKHYGNRPREPHHTVMHVATHNIGEHELTVGHFRNARAALSSINGGQ